MNILHTLSVWVACLAALSVQAAIAEPVHFVNHRADAYGGTGPNESVGPQASPIDYDFPYQVTYFTGANYGEVHASSHPGALGIYARAYNNGQYAPARQEVVTSYAFDLIFNSPGTGPVDVIMNFDLSGNIGLSPYVTSTVQVFAGISSVGMSSGGYLDTLIPNPTNPYPHRSGMLANFTADGTKQTISTGLWKNVPVNVPVRATMQLNTIQGYALDSPTIAFGNTLSLATSGDVFTILGPNAAGVTVNSEDAGIVNNSYTIPEPGTLALALVGTAVLLCRPRRLLKK